MTTYLTPQSEYDVKARRISGTRAEKVEQIDAAIQELLDIKVLECAADRPGIQFLAVPRARSHALAMTVTVLVLLIMLLLLVGVRPSHAQTTDPQPPPTPAPAAAQPAADVRGILRVQRQSSRGPGHPAARLRHPFERVRHPAGGVRHRRRA
jgi:hypothetical protein